MNYSTVTDLRWNKEHTAITCTVVFDSLGPVPFAAIEYDNTQHGREIYARCVAGDFGPIAEYIPAPDEGPQSEASGRLAIPVSIPGAIL